MTRLVAITALLLALTACGRTQPDVDLSQVGATEFALEDRQAAPSIAGPSLATGGDVAATDSIGNVTVINAWASWCAPCLTEMPILADVQRAFPDVRFLGLNALDDATSAMQFVEDVRVPFDSIRDPDGEILASLPGVPPRALPSSLVIDKQGRIAATIIGPVKEGQIDAILQRLESE